MERVIKIIKSRHASYYRTAKEKKFLFYPKLAPYIKKPIRGPINPHCTSVC